MRKSDMISLATRSMLLPYLRAIKDGRATDYDDWVLEGLQDRGFIDDKNRLTAEAEDYLRAVSG